MLDEPFNERARIKAKTKREKEKGVWGRGDAEHDDCRMNVNFKGYQNHDLHKIIRKNNYSQKRHDRAAHTHIDKMEWNTFRFFFVSFPSDAPCSLHTFRWCRVRSSARRSRRVRVESNFNAKVTNNVM